MRAVAHRKEKGTTVSGIVAARKTPPDASIAQIPVGGSESRNVDAERCGAKQIKSCRQGRAAE
jgi:hypothetical protein